MNHLPHFGGNTLQSQKEGVQLDDITYAAISNAGDQ